MANESASTTPIILLLANQGDCHERLAGLLAPKYTDINGSGAESLVQPFDLCIVDGEILSNFEQQILARKDEDAPFLPFLLVTERGNLPKIADHIKYTVDEILLTPINDLILQSRVETLLNTRKLVQEVQRLADFDELTGVLTRPASELIALLIFWLVFLNFLMMALEKLGWSVAIVPLQSFIGYLPNILAAILILVIGALLAQMLSQAVQAAVAGMGVDFHEGIGKTVQGLLLVFTVVLAVEQLGLDITLLTNTLTNLITILVAGLALAFALGGHQIARNVLAGYYAREQFVLGEELTIDGERGTLEAIGTLSAEINTPEGCVVIPNTRLTEGQVKINNEQPD
ncbi:MAG: mechanosensitive ion channel [Chloroflexi bacterium]|nr:mechanosensitive ion channel [Chloroflexota bacterium]MBL6965728.1 mechanosensitive ion channel [Anaerolineales bacterium]